MNTPAIQTKSLSKTFGRGKKVVEAVKNLSLEVPIGQVFGFLGPNGAGKTTTIRLLMDLIRPTAGEAFIFAERVNTPGALKRVGALIEGADFYPFMSGWDNLAVLGRTANDFQPERIDSLLDQVGLSKRARQNVGAYSTGMKQRLGFAAALLGDPDLLILDEPTGGLDPAGIQEMRGFIRSLAGEQGKTVFLSSHQLNEVEQICDYVAIINHGEVIHKGPVDELIHTESAQLRIEVQPRQIALNVLGERWNVEYDPLSDKEKDWITVTTGAEEAPAVIQHLVNGGVHVYQVISKHQSLEEFFLSVTNQVAGSFEEPAS